MNKVNKKNIGLQKKKPRKYAKYGRKASAKEIPNTHDLCLLIIEWQK